MKYKHYRVLPEDIKIAIKVNDKIEVASLEKFLNVNEVVCPKYLIGTKLDHKNFLIFDSNVTFELANKNINPTPWITNFSRFNDKYLEEYITYLYNIFGNNSILYDYIKSFYNVGINYTTEVQNFLCDLDKQLIREITKKWSR